MDDEIYTMDTDVDAYRTLRDQADNVEVDPSESHASDYDLLVEIGDETYGVEVDSGLAKAEHELREAGAEVQRTRERRGTKSGGITSDTMGRDMTVEEAADEALEPGEEPAAGTGSTNLRYGLGKVQAE